MWVCGRVGGVMNVRLSVLCAAALCLVWGGGAVWGGYAPEVKVAADQEKVVQAGQRAVRSMSAKERPAFLAYKLGLLFRTDYGGYSYSSSLDERFDPDSGLYYAYNAARMVTASGKEVAFKEATKKISVKKWEEAGRAMAQVGDHAVCAGFAEEVTALAKAVARRHLAQLPPVCRDAFLAIVEEAVVDKDGKPTKPRFYERSVPGMHNEKYKVPSSYFHGEKFRDREGKEQELESIIKTLRERRLDNAFDQLFWCVKLIGKEDVVAVMSEVDKKHPKGKK